MNYSELSDFEINKAVAIACGYAEENCEFGWSGKPDVGVEWSGTKKQDTLWSAAYRC